VTSGTSSERAIENLLARYAFLGDDGEFSGGPITGAKLRSERDDELSRDTLLTH
jgi:hypothetical protein